MVPEKINSLALPNQTDKPLGAARTGDEPQADLGLAEFGTPGSDANIAGQGQLAAAAQCIAVDGTDHGLVQILQRLEGVGGSAGHLNQVRPVVQFSNVRAAGQCFISCPRHNDGLDLFVGASPVHCGADVPPHFGC